MKKCVLDTNSLLHFVLFSEIDWCALLDTARVVLVFSAPVLRELDRMKFAESDIEIRNRCKKIISKISSYEDNPKVRDSVTIEFLASDVQIDWVAECLDKAIPDDRIVATALKLSQEFETVLVTADIGMRLKARFKGVKTLQLPDELAIRDKKSKEEVEVANLKSRIAFLEKKIPDLNFGIEQGEKVVPYFRALWKQLDNLDELQVRSALETARLQLSKYAIPPDSSESLRGLDKLAVPEASEYDRYRKETEGYLSDLEKYFRDDFQYRDMLSRLFSIEFVLENRGTVPADELQIKLHFPDGFGLFQESELPKEPERPREPARPSSIIDQIGRYGSRMYMTPTSPNAALLSAMNTGNRKEKPGVQIKKTKSYDVVFELEKLMHTTRTKLKKLYLCFGSYSDIRGFSCSYRIIANNIPEEVVGVVNVSFERTDD